MQLNIPDVLNIVTNKIKSKRIFNYFKKIVKAMSVEIICGKCGKKIGNMKMLKSVKDVVRPYNNKCPECGQNLSTSEFTLDVQEN